MSVDLTDPNITQAYDSIVRHKHRDWLLLTYGQQARNKLTLLSSGVGDADAIRENIPGAPEDVYFGFCREREGQRDYYVMFAYIPEDVSGVARARALVHARLVSSLFKAATISVNVKERADISSESMRERLRLPPSQIPRLASINRIAQRSASEPVGASTDADVFSVRSRSPKMRPYMSVDQGRASPVSSAGTDPSQVFHIINAIEDERPPPTPPKDWSRKPASHFVLRTKNDAIRNHASRGRAHSRSELPYASDEGDDEVVIGSYSSRGRIDFSQQRSPPRVLSPEERARQRLEEHRKREAERLLAEEEEAERQARLKREKEEMMRIERMEEDRRLTRIEEEKRIALAERERREYEEEMEEKRRLMEIEARRQRERERRIEQSRQLEFERQEAERRAAEAKRKIDEQKRLSEERRRERMKEIQEMINMRKGTDPVLLSGNVTVQSSTSISWKRRFFELTGSKLVLYRDARDRASPLDIIDLSEGRVGAIKEPDEGYEELAAIPYSFAVEFTHDDGPWSMFADSAEDKDLLISLLTQAAGL